MTISFRLEPTLDVNLEFGQLLDDCEVSGNPCGLLVHEIHGGKCIELLVGPFGPGFSGQRGLITGLLEGLASCESNPLDAFSFEVVVGSAAEDQVGAVVEVCEQFAFPVSPNIRSYGAGCRRL